MTTSAITATSSRSESAANCAAIRASASYLFARHIEPVRKNQVSFDNVVEAMKLTGDSLSYAYKETAEGGLAAILRCN